MTELLMFEVYVKNVMEGREEEKKGTSSGFGF